METQPGTRKCIQWWIKRNVLPRIKINRVDDDRHFYFERRDSTLFYKTKFMKNNLAFATNNALQRQIHARIFHISPVTNRKRRKLHQPSHNKTNSKLPLFDTRPYFKPKEHDCLWKHLPCLTVNVAGSDWLHFSWLLEHIALFNHLEMRPPRPNMRAAKSVAIKYKHIVVPIITNWYLISLKPATSNTHHAGFSWNTEIA